VSISRTPARDEEIDAAIADWLEAIESGCPHDPQEFLAQHPEIADELRAFLGDQQKFGQFAATCWPVAGSHGPGALTQLAGRRLGDFEIVREIGRGGMGVIFEARQLSLKRTVALKVLLPLPGLDVRAIERFHREAEAAAMLRHPQIIPIYATGEDQGHHFYAMELVVGPSLDRLLQADAADGGSPVVALASDLQPGGQRSFCRIAGLLADAALALHHAHEHGVIHRDVKPSNLLLAADGRLCVSDFGLARIDDAPGLTLSSEIIGSPAYMSPEQVTGRSTVDRRSDVYSLGATLYECLAQRSPFAGARRDEVLVKIVSVEPPPPRYWNPGVPAALETICLKAMEKAPGQRYQTAAEFAHDLHSFATGRSITARRPGSLRRIAAQSRQRPAVAALVAVVLAAAGLAGYFAYAAHSSRAALAVAQLDDLVDEGLIANLSGDPDAAVRAIAKVAAAEPASGWLPLLRGHLAFQRGDYDDAVQYLEQAAELLPDSVAARALLASAYVAAGWWERYEELLADVERLEAHSPEDFMFRGLAESYLDPAKARASLDAAIRGRRLPVAYLLRAEVCSQLAMDSSDRRDADAAMADARLACELLGEIPDALLERLFACQIAAGIYRDLGLADQANVLLAAADQDAITLARHVRLPSVARALAWYYLQTHREQAAVEILQAAAPGTENARVNYRYALLLYRRGALDAGLAVLERRAHRSHNEDLLRVLFLAELPGGPPQARAAYETLRDQPVDGLAALFQPALLCLLGDWPAAVADSRHFRDQENHRLPSLRRAFYEQVLQFNCDELGAEGLLATAGRSQWDRCEANFFIGLRHLARGDRTTAARHFQAAVATRCYGFLAFDWSQTFLLRLSAEPRWPGWIP
jgi:tetratricopeptide (TPR) repeat protein